MTFEQTPIPAVVRAIRDVASDVRLFELDPEGGARSYAVGSHLDVQVEVEGRTEHRSFSLVGDGVGQDCYRLGVKNRPDGCGGSRYLWARSPGDRLWVSQPKEEFALYFHAPEYLFVAGGIGITPLYGMIMSLTHRQANVRLFYAAHSEAQLAFVEALREALGNRLQTFISERGQRIDPQQAIRDLHPEAELYVCGPIGLRENLQRAWRVDGRSAAHFRFETFASGGHYPDEPFEVEVVNRGKRFVVERGQSLLQALYAHGIDDVLYDCERGECGLCAVRVTECSGKIDHRDVFYTDRQHAAGHRICACVSRVVGGSIAIDTSRQLVDAGQIDASP